MKPQTYQPGNVWNFLKNKDNFKLSFGMVNLLGSVCTWLKFVSDELILRLV